jgi:hypothetical protein
MSSEVRSGTDVLTWNEAVLAAIRATRPAPPVAARALAEVHTAMYDAWAVYDERAVGTRLGFVPAPADRGPAARAEAVGYAAYHVLLDLFPDRRAGLDATMAEVDLAPDAPAADPGTPAWVGAAAARAVVDARHGDGANQLGTLAPGAYSDWTGYVPVNTPDEVVVADRWQPLRVPDGRGGSTVQRFAAPHWGLVVPFASPPVLTDRVPPAPAGTPQFTEQAQQLVDISGALSDREKVIAQYWADGPNSELPPATGACSRGSCPAGTDMTWTPTSCCSSHSPTRCSTPGSRPGISSASTTTSGRSPRSASCSPAAGSGRGAVPAGTVSSSTARSGSRTRRRRW